MQSYKREFIEFMVEAGVLTFGDFVTKSGRRTPFFINTGNYDSGGRLSRLGWFYARTLRDGLGEDFDFLFGPAYKGIPLVAATAAALSRDFGMDVKYCFNRKEEKDHGEGGALVGYRPRSGDRAVIVEDVTTAGTSIRETVPLLKRAGAVEIAALLVSVDRQERGRGELSALQELRDEFGLRPLPIVTLSEIVEHLAEHEVAGRVVLDRQLLTRIDDYRQRYGCG